MGARKKQRRLAVWATLAAVSAVASAVACNYGGTDEVTRDLGSSGGPGTGISSGADSGLQGLCGRAGGPSVVKAITADAMQRLQADCRIGAYFTNLSASDQQHLSECMEIYLDEVFTCPGVTYTGSKDSAGNACRAMNDAHRNMGITSDDEKAFQDAFVGALRDTGKLVPTDVGNVITHMAGERGIYSANSQGNPKCSCNPDTQCAPTPPPPPPKDGGTDSSPPPNDAGSDSAVITDTGAG